ncbi:MAG: hypothetical protein WCJ30_24910, partial [Deltaproteobacteria bacterium]
MKFERLGERRDGQAEHELGADRQRAGAGGIDGSGAILNTAGIGITINADNIHGVTITNTGTLVITNDALSLHGDIGDTLSPVTITGANRMDLTPTGDGQISLIGDTLNLGNVTAKGTVTLDGDVVIVIGGTFAPGSNIVYVSGDWKINHDNLGHYGTFVCGTSTIVFNTLDETTIEDDNTFYNFTSVTPSKVIYFEVGKTQTILGAFRVQGAEGGLIKLISSEEGRQWYIDPQG